MNVINKLYLCDAFKSSAKIMQIERRSAKLGWVIFFAKVIM